MTLSNRERLLRLKTLRAEKAAASLAAARTKTATEVRAEKAAQMTLKIRSGTEQRKYAQTYRDLVGQSLDRARFDAIDGTLIALADATATAKLSVDEAVLRLQNAQQSEELARQETIKSERARDVWDKLATDARADATRHANARAQDAAEAATEIGTLTRSGAQ